MAWRGGFIPICVYTVIMVVLVLVPPYPGKVVLLTSVPKILKHFMASAIFSVLIFRYLKNERISLPQLLCASALIPFVFGIIAELVQVQIPYRSGRWQDLLPNAGGILVAHVLLLVGWSRGQDPFENPKTEEDSDSPV